MAVQDVVALPERGASLVATWGRWGAATALLAAVAVAIAQAYLALSGSQRSLPSLSPLMLGACAFAAALVWATLRAEELRLSRELRTARTGTAAVRAMVTHRRQQTSLLGRLFAAKLGTAAIFLADGDQSGALDALSSESPLMRGGRLEKVRATVHADAERAGGTGGVERCVQSLRAMPRIGNREADLYRTHVLVKALLEQGDARAALDLARDLRASRDEEERMYLVWLRVWFDLDAEAETSDETWPLLSDGELRMAVLPARSQGAEKLVEKLEGRLTAIARSKEGE